MNEFNYRYLEYRKKKPIIYGGNPQKKRVCIFSQVSENLQALFLLNLD